MLSVMFNGGKRPKAGRPKGRLNAVTREIRAAAQAYTDEALQALVRVMRDKKAPHAAVVSASTTIIAYGHGKPRQAIEHSGAEGGPLEIKVTRTIVRPVAASG